MSEIRTALASLGNHALAFVSQMGPSNEMFVFPPLRYWITPSTVFTMSGFALFAILAFVGFAITNKRSRTLLIGGYVLATFIFVIGCWQAARQEQVAAETQKLSASLADPIPPVQPDITMRLLEGKGPTEDSDQVDVSIPPKNPRSITMLRVTHPRVKYWGD
jgi:hypothetical protein